MISVTQFAETLRQILEEEANQLAKETGFIQRERTITGADFAQTLIFGWLGEPEITLDGLTQVAGRREVEITASGLCQRFPPQAHELRNEIPPGKQIGGTHGMGNEMEGTLSRVLGSKRACRSGRDAPVRWQKQRNWERV